MYIRTGFFIIMFVVLQANGQRRDFQIRPTNTPCANSKGTIAVIKDIALHSTRSLEVCYNTNTGEVFYTKHVVPPSICRLPEPKFKDTGLTFDPNEKYKIVNEIRRFETILGTAAGKYIKNCGGPYLARGHLSPDADFSSLDSIATYYYVNVVPQWQSINTGNWKSVENRVRKAAEAYGDLTVVTGTHEVLSLPDNRGQLKDIYLAHGKLPVPKYIWKVIYNSQLNGIAFISVNDPYLTTTQGLLPCTNICERFKWSKPEWNDLSKGYTYCCEVKQFQSFVATAPDFSFMNGILQAP